MAEIRVHPKPRSRAWLWLLLTLVVVAAVAWYLWSQGLLGARNLTQGRPAAAPTLVAAGASAGASDAAPGRA